MIPYNITPGTKVRNIKTRKERAFERRVTIYKSHPTAHLSGLRWMRWETFSRNYEVVSGNPSLMTSIG